MNMNYDDPCKESAPTIPCRLCGQLLEPDLPWIDWRWGEHDGCDYCGPIGHDMVQPFHVECVQALMRAYQNPRIYLPDEPNELLDSWLCPILWKTVWMPEQVTISDAELARLVYDRIACSLGLPTEGDPSTMNPFRACDWIFNSKDEFQTEAMIPYAKSLGLTCKEADCLPLLLEDTGHGWEASYEIRRASRSQLIEKVQELASALND